MMELVFLEEDLSLCVLLLLSLMLTLTLALYPFLIPSLPFLFSLPLSNCTHWGKARWGHSKKAAIYKSGGEPSPRIELADTLTLTSQKPELWEIWLFLSYPAYGISL